MKKLVLNLLIIFNCFIFNACGQKSETKQVPENIHIGVLQDEIIEI